MRFFALRLRLCRFRGSERLARRRLRPAQDAHSHRPLVVVLHGADRVGRPEPVGIVFGLPAADLCVRFLFGMGEAGAYPNITQALHNWFPFGERGMGQGTVWMCGRFMGGLTPARGPEPHFEFGWNLAAHVLDLRLLRRRLVRPVLLVVPQSAREKPRSTRRNSQLITAGPHDAEVGARQVSPGASIASQPNLWALCFMYFCASYGWYFNIYLSAVPDEAASASIRTPAWRPSTRAARSGSAPPACLVGGFLTDRLHPPHRQSQVGPPAVRRRRPRLAAGLLFLSVFWPTPFTFFLAISFACLLQRPDDGLRLGELPRTSASAMPASSPACMNTVGNLGALPPVTSPD